MKKAIILILSALTAIPLTAFADITTYETFTGTEENLLSFTGHDPGEQFGASVSKGDFNNDGIDDLVVGSPFSSSGLREWNGRVSIIFGSQGAKRGNIELSDAGSDIGFYGSKSGDQLGNSIAVGDFNNDGIDDIAIGAHNALTDKVRSGKVYLVYGKTQWNNRALNFSNGDFDVQFIGRSDGDNFGIEMHASDINNDGVDDLMIAAPEAIGPSEKRVGAVYAYFGSDSGFENDTYKVANNLADVNFFGQVDGEKFGSAIESGLIINSSGKTDIIIGAYKSKVGNKVGAGRVYVYKGRNTYLRTIKSPTSIIEGQEENAWFSFDIAVGDMNNDGKEDIAVSAFPYLTNNRSGKTFVYYGGNRFGHDGLIQGSENHNVLIDSPVGEQFLGSSVLLDDYDADGRDDLLIGAPGIAMPSSNEAGSVYGVFSGGQDFASDYSVKAKTISSTIHGLNADDWFGYKINSLDFNNDGKLDLAVGSRYSDAENSKNNGKVFILYGNNGPFGLAKTVKNPADRYLTRAELITMVVESFNLLEVNESLIQDCYDHIEFCLFNFTTMSRYEAMNLDPADLRLYPDVPKDSRYAKEINLATMLGLINGFMNEQDSPFHPEREISRIQALKIVLSINKMVENKYKFELNTDDFKNSYFEDISSEISYMWWYPRYTNFAVQKNIIENVRFFRPDDSITHAEALALIEKTASYLNSQDAEAKL